MCLNCCESFQSRFSNRPIVYYPYTNICRNRGIEYKLEKAENVTDLINDEFSFGAEYIKEPE